MTKQRPSVIVLCGPPCSGKTTLAAKFHAETGIAYLAIDNILPRILPDSLFQQADRDIAYRTLGFTTEQLLRAGEGVIVDGTFARAPHLEDLEDIANTCKAVLYLVECKIDVAIAIRRFQDRGGQHPAVDLDEARVQHLNRTYPYRLRGLVLDTSLSISECMASIRRYIGNT